MTKPTILVATWGDGLFAVTGDGSAQEIANQPTRGLAPDGRGGALAIVDRHSLRRRAPSGAWATVATSEFELSCCMAVRDTIYAGTDDARMLCLSYEGGVLDPIDGFDNVAGRDVWFAGSAIVNGQASRATARYSLGCSQLERKRAVRQRSRGRHSAFRGWRKNLAAHHRHQQRCS